MSEFTAPLFAPPSSSSSGVAWSYCEVARQLRLNILRISCFGAPVNPRLTDSSPQVMRSREAASDCSRTKTIKRSGSARGCG
jgi:hypothetical protein